MLTGHGTVDSAIEGMKLGAFDYLIKPCDVDTLISKMTAAKKIVDDKMMRIAEARVAEITLRRGD
jgi:ActR/RegA family two-component response regulator